MNSRRTGAKYEQQAARFLEEQGFQIVECNFCCRQGEIDLIARDGSCLVFIEVKYRRNAGTGHPAEAVDARKQRRLSRAAAYYCLKNRIPETQACRFDVVSILGEQVELIKDAFSYVGQ